MAKLFHFDCPQEVYTADACVITCFDARFDLAMRKFLRRRGIVTYDHIKTPGPVKSLAQPDIESDRDFLLRGLRTSMRLHSPTRVLLFGHNDCGAYGGTPVDVMLCDQRMAAGVLKAAEPSLALESYFADFDGIYGVD